MESPSRSLSPAKGLEKLVQELKLERTKSTTAIQERARLKIEHEKLKQSFIEIQEELQSTEQHNQQLLDSFTKAEQKIYELEHDLDEKRQENQEILRENKKINDQLQITIQELNEMKENSTHFLSNEGVDPNYSLELETKLQSKNTLIKELEDEIKQLKKINETNDKKIFDLTRRVELLDHETEDIRSLHTQIEELTSSYSRLHHSHEEVKKEFEESIERNSDLTARLKDVTELFR